MTDISGTRIEPFTGQLIFDTSTSTTATKGAIINTNASVSSPVTSVSARNVGAGDGVFSTVSGTSSDIILDFKSLKSGNGITLSSDGESITINSNTVTTFLGLTDTPNTYVANTILAANSTATGIVALPAPTVANTNLRWTGSQFIWSTAGAGGGEANTGFNLGTASPGANGIYSQKIGDELQFKSLIAGSGISLSSTSDLITISSNIVPGEINAGANVGVSGVGSGRIYKDKTGLNLNFRSIVSGSGVSISEGVNDITISATTTGEANDGVNIGASGARVYANKSGVSLQFRRLISGSNIDIIEGVNDITINSLGEANTASNLGLSGAGKASIFSAKSGVDLQFRRLQAGTNTTFVETADTVIINSLGENNAAVNVGSGVGVFGQKNGSTLEFRTLTAGPGIGLAVNGSELQISLSGSAGEVNSGVNLGSSGPNIVDLYAGKAGTDLQFRRIAGGTSVQVTQNASQVIISTDAEANTASNLGVSGVGYAEIFANKVGADLQFKRLRAGSNITLTQNANEVTISGTGGSGGASAFTDLTDTPATITASGLLTGNSSGTALTFISPTGTGTYLQWTGTNFAFASGTGENNIGQNLGTGTGIYSGKSGVTLQYRSLIAGSGITITPSADEILISSTATGGGIVNNAANVGNTSAGTAGLFRDLIGDTLNFRRIVGTGSVLISQNTNDITISGTGVSGAVNLGTGGAGTGAVFKSVLGNDIQLRTLRAGSNITIAENPDELLISANGASSFTQLTDTPNSIVDNGLVVGVGSNLTFTSAPSSSNTFLRWNGVSFDWVSPIGAGTITNGSNLGSSGANRVEVFAQATGADLEFKRLVGGTGVTLTQTSTEITISSSSTGISGITVSDEGSTVGDVGGITNLNFVGNGVAVTGSGSTLTVTVSGGGASTLNDLTDVNTTGVISGNALVYDGTEWKPASVGTLTGGTNLGSSGARVFDVVASNNLSFRRLIAGTNVTIVENTNDITISATASSGSSTLAGLTDVSIGSATNGQVLTFNGTNWTATTVSSGGPIALDDITDVIITTPSNNQVLTYNGSNWVNTNNNNVTSGANLGASGSSIYNNTASGVMNFRKLIAGTNVTIVENIDDVTISATAGASSGPTSYEFIVNFTGTNPTSITNVPAGWTIDILNTDDLLITHNIGSLPIHAISYGQKSSPTVTGTFNGTHSARVPASTAWEIQTNPSELNRFAITNVTTTNTAAASGTSAIIKVLI